MSYQKYFLVPQNQYHQQLQGKHEMLDTITKPMDESLFRTAQDLNKIGRGESSDLQNRLHAEALTRLNLLRDKTTAPIASLDKPIAGALSDASILKEMPFGAQTNTQNLLYELKKAGLSYNDKGKVTSEGTLWRGSHILDLISSIVRDQKSRAAPVHLKNFLNLMYKANAPIERIKNTAHRGEYSRLQAGGMSERRRSNSLNTSTPKFNFVTHNAANS